MELSPKTSRALDACYDAVIMPSRWTAALDELAHSLGAQGCLIVPHEINDREYGVVWSTECWKVQDVYLRNRDWIKPTIEPRADPYVRRAYNAVRQSQLFSEEELRTSRFHNEYQRPAGVHDFVAGMFATENRDWCLPFYKRGEPFSGEAVVQIAEVARRMARIVSISEKLTRLTAENEIQTLARMSRAAVLLDRFGRVGAANQQAEEHFCAGFGIRHGRLWTASAANLARLDRFIASIAAAVAGPLHVGAQPRLKSALSAEFPPPIIITRDSAPWLLI